MPSADTYDFLLSPFALAVFGLCVGSFLNVVVHRVPLMMERAWKLEAADILELPAPDAGPPLSLVRPRSRCPSCGHAIAWYENIPVASWLWLRGRCSACAARISARYPLVEAATAVLFALIGWKMGAQPTTLLWCGFAATLIALALIDFDTTFLPDDLVLPLAWAGIAAAWLGWLPLPLPASVGGAIGGYLSLYLVGEAYKLLRGREGMARGDCKLLAALGAWLGWQLLPSIVLLSSAVGALIGGFNILIGHRDWTERIPFGPYLVGGGLAAYFFGAELTALWLPHG